MSGERSGLLEGLSLALRLLRKRAGLTQKALAERSGVRHKLIRGYERGHHRPPLETLAKILAALDADLLELHLALHHARGEPPPPIKRAPGASSADKTDDAVAEICEAAEQFLDSHSLLNRLSFSRWLREALKEAIRRP